MTDLQIRAIEKLDKEFEEAKKSFGRAAAVMAPDTKKALVSFIEQDEEFADAILQNSQTFGDCMKAVEKNCGSALSDFEAFKRAVQFYFPGAEIEYQMKLYVNPYELEDKKKAEQKQNFKTLSLFDVM